MRDIGIAPNATSSVKSFQWHVPLAWRSSHGVRSVAESLKQKLRLQNSRNETNKVVSNFSPLPRRIGELPRSLRSWPERGDQRLVSRGSHLHTLCTKLRTFSHWSVVGKSNISTRILLR